VKRADFEAFAPYFSAAEQWGDIEALEWVTVWALYRLRVTMVAAGHDWPIVVHDATGPGHSPTGYHPRGLAVDFHFGGEAAGMRIADQADILEAALAALRLDRFTGLGVYPDWHRPGFHLDLRGRRARWGRLGHRYVAWDEAIAASRAA